MSSQGDGWVSTGPSPALPPSLPARAHGKVLEAHIVPTTQLRKIQVGSVVEVELEGEVPGATVWGTAKVRGSLLPPTRAACPGLASPHSCCMPWARR